MTARTLPDAAQARLEQVRVEAEREFSRPYPLERAQSEFPAGLGDLILLEWPGDRPTHQFVSTMADAILTIVCGVAVADRWPADALRVDVTTRLENLIAEAYALKHSQCLPLADFRRQRHDVIRTLSSWEPYLNTVQQLSVPGPVREPTRVPAELPPWAKQLRQWRDDAGITIEELARQMKYRDTKTVKQHLNGTANPQPKTRHKYIKVFTSLIGPVKFDR